MSLMTALLWSSALFSSDVPAAERLQRLSPYFAPSPGQELRLDAAEQRDFRKVTSAASLRGSIIVTPPKGHCLTITRSVEAPDVRICKKTMLKFALADLDKHGRVVWAVSTGDGDFGTELVWPTPYRTAIVTPFDRSLQDPPEYKFIDRCVASKDGGRRKIEVELVSGEKWVIAFPQQDFQPPQPDPIPNLHMHTGGKVTLKDAQATSATPNNATPDGEAPPPPSPKEDGVPPAESDRAIWAIPLRGAYEMPASAFMPYGSVPPGGQGRCRYHYEGPPEDRTTGRLECHEVDGFKSVYLPLTCLGSLRP